MLFSDFTDPTAAELMVESIGRLVDRHLVLFVTIADSETDRGRCGVENKKVSAHRAESNLKLVTRSRIG